MDLGDKFVAILLTYRIDSVPCMSKKLFAEGCLL